MYRLKQLTLLAGDLIGLYTGLYLALWLRYLTSPNGKFFLLLKPMSLLFLAAAIILFIVGLYDVGKLKNSWTFYQKIITGALLWTGLSIVYFYFYHDPGIAPKTILALTAAIGFGFVAVWRLCYNAFIAASLWQTNVVFAGVTTEVQELVATISKEPQRGYTVAGIITDRPIADPLLANLPQGKHVTELKTIRPNQQPIGLIVLSPAIALEGAFLKELYQSLFEHVSVVSLADFYEELMQRIPPFTFSEAWFIAHLPEQRKKMYDRFRVLVDYLFALFLAIVFVITFPLIALAIKLSSFGPTFFKQKRVGRNGSLFTVYKYRTMKALAADGSAETQGPQFAAAKDYRVTAVGKFLRATRLDEVPQFINILKGEMSIIGPRPERPEFVSQLTETMPYYALRHLIKPGLTGWAQIHRAYYGTLEENLQKLEYDLFYIKNRSFLFDVSIILRTFNIIVRMIGR